MKNIVPFLILASFCCSCNNTTTTTTTTFDSTSTVITSIDPKRELFVLDSVLKQYETPMQHFKASYAHPMKIKGAKGTIISVEPADLVTISGKPMNASIDIELKELTTTEELARDRVVTTSNGRLLVAVSAYYINMTCNGEQLKLKPDSYLSVDCPKEGRVDEFVFSGQRDTLHQQINWTITKQKFEVMQTYNDALVVDGHENIAQYKDTAAQNKLVYTSLQGFGWFACGHFLGSDNLTDCSVEIDRKDSINCVSMYMLFKDVNCLMQGYFSSDANKYTFSFIPVGTKGVFIAIGFKNGKTYTYRSDMTITRNQKMTIKLKETAEKDVSGLFKMN